MQCYEAVPHSCVLDVARNFIVLFAKDESMQPRMQDFFRHLISRTMREITMSSNPSDFTDLIASFFGILTQVVKKAPILLATGVDLIGVFDAACGCLAMPESGPVKNSSMFLSNFIMISRENPVLTEIINHRGSKLFRTTLALVGGESARSFTEHYVDIIFAFSKKYFDNMRQWLQEMVNIDNFPTSNVTREQKNLFATAVLRERTNKRKLLEVTRSSPLVAVV